MIDNLFISLLLHLLHAQQAYMGAGGDTFLVFHKFPSHKYIYTLSPLHNSKGFRFFETSFRIKKNFFFCIYLYITLKYWQFWSTVWVEEVGKWHRRDLLRKKIG